MALPPLPSLLTKCSQTLLLVACAWLAPLQAEEANAKPPAAAAKAQHSELGMSVSGPSDQHTRHPGAQWFPQAGLGLFIHWGISSVSGKTDLSWGMVANTPYDAAANGRNKMTPEAYWAQADQFQPTRYDPDKWLKAAAAAGFQYAVLTTMHHDGYTLWPSKFSALGVQNHFGGRDLVREFVDACRKNHLKVGLYYSPVDWYEDRDYKSFNYGSANQAKYPGRRAFNVRHEPVDLPTPPADFTARQKATYLGRIRELLTNYGPIDLLWLDGGRTDPEVLTIAHDLQPHIVVNSRSCNGDYGHSEGNLPASRPQGWFETCDVWQLSNVPNLNGVGFVGFWGYLKEERYKSTAWMISNLVRLRAWGANYLINVGPRPNGELPDVVYQRFSETKAWMDRNRESVIGTTAGTYPENCNVPETVRGKTHYLHLLAGHEATARLNDVAKPKSVTLLSSGQAVPFTWSNRQLTVTLPPAQRTAIDDVIAVQLP